MSFHGSYRPDDVEFLLKPISMTFVMDIDAKERLIQSGERHYSEMLSPEELPSEQYQRLFFRAHQAARERMARDCLHLASAIVGRHGQRPTLVSLARAGTPIGAVVSHLIGHLYDAKPKHFSLSIVRDRGIDMVALDRILERGFSPESIAFIDGWTGKGVISQELLRAIHHYNESRRVKIDGGLYVLSDLAGTAAYAASDDDYLISSSILNSTISGLVSRSVLNELIGPDDFHGCVFYDKFLPHDISRWFVDDIVSAALSIAGSLRQFERIPRENKADIRHAFLVSEMARRRISNINLIKPGIGEATRVLLRRKPGVVFVKDMESESVAHLIELAMEKGVPLEVVSSMPYNAMSIIGNVADA